MPNEIFGRSLLPKRGGNPSAAAKPPVRPVISGPMGPVRRSDGNDLQRGDTLTVVPTIEDCAVTDEDVKRLSAGFSYGGPLTSHPVVGSTSINATVNSRSTAPNKAKENVKPS